MNKLLASALILISLGTASAHTYFSPDHRYSLTTPDTWSPHSNVVGADLILNVPGTPGAINLLTTVGQALPQGMDLAGYTKATLDALPGMMKDVSVNAQRALTVGHLPARELQFTGHNRVGNRPVYGQVLLVVKDGRGYTLSYLGEQPRGTVGIDSIRHVLTSLTLLP